MYSNQSAFLKYDACYGLCLDVPLKTHEVIGEAFQRCVMLRSGICKDEISPLIGWHTSGCRWWEGPPWVWMLPMLRAQAWREHKGKQKECLSGAASLPHCFATFWSPWTVLCCVPLPCHTALKSLKTVSYNKPFLF